MRRKLDAKGFTLVELAIVMVIIGLLIGAVLKGQAMIDDARQKRLMNDLQGFTAAYYTYFDRYNALPGDDANANGRWAAVANGNGNGFIAGDELTAAGESGEAWQALRFAGLLSGNPNTTGRAALPQHPFSGRYGIGDFGFANGIGFRNRIIVDNIPGEVAERIDIKLDDGVFNTGTVQGSGVYTRALVDLNCAL